MKRTISISILSIFCLSFISATTVVGENASLLDMSCLNAVSQTHIIDAGYTYFDSNTGTVYFQVGAGDYDSSKFEVIAIKVVMKVDGEEYVTRYADPVPSNSERAFVYERVEFRNKRQIELEIYPTIEDVELNQTTCVVSSKITISDDTPAPEQPLVYCNDPDGPELKIIGNFEIEYDESGAHRFTKTTVTTVTTSSNESYTDYCRDDGSGVSLIEYACKGAQYIQIEHRNCIYGCEDGACIMGPNETISDLPNETEIPQSNETEIPQSNETEIPSTDETSSHPETTEVNACKTCLIGEACFPFGYRKDGNYCNADELNFTQYKDSGEICENSFECNSNLCIDNECISGGLFRRIANWFRRVFGE